MFATIWARPLFVVFNTHAVVAHRCHGADGRGTAFPSPSSRRIRPRVAVVEQLYNTESDRLYMSPGRGRGRRKGREGEGGREEERRVEKSVEHHYGQRYASELVRVLKQSRLVVSAQCLQYSKHFWSRIWASALIVSSLSLIALGSWLAAVY